MKYLNNYLELTKLYRSDEIKNTKTFLLVIANIWLLLIFWKILLISDASIINNNATLTKASLLLQPILGAMLGRLGLNIYSNLSVSISLILSSSKELKAITYNND